MEPSNLHAVSKSSGRRMQPSESGSQVGERSMRALQLIHRQARSEVPAGRYEGDFAETRPRKSETPNLSEFPMPGLSALSRGDALTPSGSEGFFKDLSAEARYDFASLATHFRCPGSTVLISEAQEPSRILFLLEGGVNISMNSSDGRRLLLGVAGAGDTLGLTSAISGDSSEIRAQAMYPCSIASLRRRDFLGILSRHPSANQNVARELCAELARVRGRLRTFGLTSSAMARLAHLLLEWCGAGHPARDGIQIKCALTHREIGECIGASRETVTRALADFKAHDLVRLHGSNLVVTSPSALATYARVDSIPDPRRPAA
jgi:CRP/FNR family transcriptional regulator